MRIDRESLLTGLPENVAKQFRSYAITASVEPGERYDIGMAHFNHNNPEKAVKCMEWVLLSDKSPPAVLNWTAAAILQAAAQEINTPAQRIAPLAIKVLENLSTYGDQPKISADARCILAKYSPHTINDLRFP